jgi:hypothetical protein
LLLNWIGLIVFVWLVYPYLKIFKHVISLLRVAFFLESLARVLLSLLDKDCFASRVFKASDVVHLVVNKEPK